MSKRKGKIPTSDAELPLWGGLFATTIATNAESWEIPAAEAQAVQASYSAFMNLYTQITEGTRTEALTAAKNAAKEEFLVKVRAMVNFRLKNPKIPEAALKLLGLYRDPSRTPVGVPTVHVELTVRPSNVREHKITWRVLETGSKAVPEGFSGVVLRKQVLEEGEAVPVEQASLSYSRLLTKNNVTETFRIEDQGKRCAYAACWQNEKGEEGAWSDIIIVIVP